jgi:hypothetical protein
MMSQAGNRMLVPWFKRAFGLFLVGSFLTASLAGCAYTTAVSTTNIPANRSKKVKASTKRYIIFNFVFDNDEVLALPQKLGEQCLSGAVRGITTHNINTFYFLAFFWSREVVATGYCVKDKVASSGGDMDHPISPVSDMATQDQVVDGVSL